MIVLQKKHKEIITVNQDHIIRSNGEVICGTLVMELMWDSEAALIVKVLSH